jgi:hypothetical protein
MGDVRVTSVYRGPGIQARLFSAYLRNRHRDPTGEGVRYLPAAAPGGSLHQYRRAFDLSGSDAHLAELGRVWQQWGGVYGGAFHDPVHFEA